MAKRGRPSSFTQEMADRICAEIATGKSMREICRAEDAPDMTTVFRWLAAPAREEFRQQYVHAREAQADYLGEEILEIADDATNDWMARQQGEETVRVIDHEHVSRSKLRVDARKWLMSKLQPKKYGDKITQEVTGKDGAPLAPVLNVTIASDRPQSPPEAGNGSTNGSH